MNENIDLTMEAIGAAVQQGHAGDVAGARRKLLALWREIGAGADPLHRCTLAHYLADLHDHAGEALAWDVRALDAADTLTDERAQRQHTALRVRGFYPSLHLNLADDYRRLGAFEAAGAQLDAAKNYVDELGQDAYGQGVLAGLTHVADAISTRSTERLPTH